MEKNKYLDYAKNANAITLVALRITIIVLLILAGVTLSLTLGEKGIFKIAIQSKEEYNRQSAREKLEIALLNSQKEKVLDSKYNQNEYINPYLQNINMDINEDTVTVDGFKFNIDRSVPKIGEEIPQEAIGKIVTFGDKSNEYDGISGKCEEFIVPYTGYYKLEVWGAQGGAVGGKGGYSSGCIKLQKGEKLYVYIGGRGVDSIQNYPNYLVGGFNGGGNSGIPSYYTPHAGYGMALRFRRRSNRYKKSKSNRGKMV